FLAHFTAPTAAQRHAWPIISRGDNLVLSAPTGSGKSLAAFVPILGQLLTEPRPGVACLYLAPLKALAADLLRNLRRAAAELRRHEPAFVSLRTAIRTGDTPARLRRRMLLRPPAILLTTPESLAVLLAQASAESLFAHLRWVVVDEVHALAACKRGADLAL